MTAEAPSQPQPPTDPPLERELRALVERLAAIERPSASSGERAAAELLREEFAAFGVEGRVEREKAHGTYWWPVGIPTLASALAAWRARRPWAALVGTLAAAAVVDDITGGKQLFRRTLLPRRDTWNFVAEIGPPDAARTVIVVAHHDAAHPGLVFHPELPRTLARTFPRVHRHLNATPPTMWGAVAGPLAVALGALFKNQLVRAVGGVVNAGYVLAMADIALRKPVPGANDNLSGVAAIWALGRRLARHGPPAGLRVVLVSTGSEESFMEGMQAFARRHFAAFDRERTAVICLDTVGSPHLLALEGEGMVWMNRYSRALIELAHECARELGIFLWRGLRLRNATDGLIALRHGFPALAIGSCDRYKIPSNYHWPTDTPDRVDYGTVADCVELVALMLERIAGGAALR